MTQEIQKDDNIFDPGSYHKQIKISIHGAKYLTNDRKQFYVTEISSASSHKRKGKLILEKHAKFISLT